MAICPFLPQIDRRQEEVISELVQRLAKGTHRVAAGGPSPSVQLLKEEIDRDFVHIKFVETKGGTDLGVRLDSAACVLDGANFTLVKGTTHLEGTLTLNSVPVRCVADLDLETLSGNGHLIILDSLPSKDAN
jgi:hypothetical protein